MRHTKSSSGQILSLIILRTAVIGFALWLWWTGQATAGEGRLRE
jgi:ATP-binding cassette subfamily B protein